MLIREQKRRRLLADVPISAFSSHGNSTLLPHGPWPLAHLVRRLLQQYAVEEECSLPGITAWSIPLRDDAGGGDRVNLHVLCENVQQSERLHCDHCRLAGRKLVTFGTFFAVPSVDATASLCTIHILD